MKKIIMTIVLVSCMGTVCLAQPSLFSKKPQSNNAVGGTNENSSSNDNTDGTSGYGDRKSSAPIGTATALLLSLGAGYTGYKIIKKRKEEDKENEDL